MLKQLQSLKFYGWVWIIISPVIFMMALISSVDSQTTYYAQLGTFGVVSVLGIVSGIGLALAKNWARKILRVLSWIVCLYYFGSATLMLGFSIKNNVLSEQSIPIWALLVFLGVAVIGYPFLVIARELVPPSADINDS